MVSLIARLGEHAVAGGSVLALALVCCLQYWLHLQRMIQARSQHAGLRAKLAGLETEMGDMQRDRALTELENEILREFLSQTDTAVSLDVLVKRYVPNVREDFAALILVDGDRWTVSSARGLSKESLGRMRLDRPLWERLVAEGHVTLEQERAFDSEFFSLLTAEDRRKARAVHLTAVSDGNQPLGAFVSTALYPDGASLVQQRSLIRRLMASLAANLKQCRALAERQEQLWCTNEMLELREIADQRFETPIQMLEAFVDALRRKVDADRASLAVTSDGGRRRTLVRCGIELEETVSTRWKECEETLAVEAAKRFDSLELGRDGLGALGVPPVVQRALAIPLVNTSRHLGALCLSRRDREPFTPIQRQLADWAGEHLAETIVRALAQAVVVRAAQVDCLTELANRRTFDHQIERELSTSRRIGSECSLLLLDIDRFKLVNDHHGHLAGDEVLRHVAHALRERSQELRATDRAILARFGGEELAVILPGIGMSGALRIAEVMRTAIEDLDVRFHGASIPVTASFGVATAPYHGTTPAQLIGAADAALYRAKDEGRNRVAAAVSSSHDATASAPVGASAS